MQLVQKNASCATTFVQKANYRKQDRFQTRWPWFNNSVQSTMKTSVFGRPNRPQNFENQSRFLWFCWKNRIAGFWLLKGFHFFMSL